MADPFDTARDPHRRLNVLTGEWHLVSPHRADRPWRGREEPPPFRPLPDYDADCYLCPGNVRAGGLRNPRYDRTHVFTNDFAALRPDAPQQDQTVHRLLQAKSVQGTCRVICYSPRHDLTLAEMDSDAIGGVIDEWCAQESDLRDGYAWVQIFENKGEMMGTSAPHPHGQVWAVSELPLEALREDQQQRNYMRYRRTQLLTDYLALEIERRERVVVEHAEWVAVTPWWALWPFETLLVPRRHLPTLSAMSASERESLGLVLKELLARYDNLFEAPFPYSMGWHSAPGAGEEADHWQLHAHFYPPLLRSAAIRKFMVGYELLAEGQRDLTPEAAAARLREVPSVHYRSR